MNWRLLLDVFCWFITALTGANFIFIGMWFVGLLLMAAGTGAAYVTARESRAHPR